jgi:hypothetical protein
MLFNIVDDMLGIITEHAKSMLNWRCNSKPGGWWIFPIPQYANDTILFTEHALTRKSEKSKINSSFRGTPTSQIKFSQNGIVLLRWGSRRGCPLCQTIL